MLLLSKRFGTTIQLEMLSSRAAQLRPARSRSTRRALHAGCGQSGMHAVTVISTSKSAEPRLAITLVLAGLSFVKYFAYSSL